MEKYLPVTQTTLFLQLPIFYPLYKPYVEGVSVVCQMLFYSNSSPT